MTTLQERLGAALAGEYDAVEELASGGMGVVYRARDRQLDRLVAIKIIRPELATASAAERFVREARLLASFSHPNIVPIHRAGDAGGIAYYVMDYLDGESLAERLARGPLQPDEARRVAEDLLAALEAVHARGIIHRDVKPSNVFLSGERAVLSDFGVSKSSDPAVSALTRPGQPVGTVGYMPPEQLAGTEVLPAADVCSAAMVMFEAWTGRTWVFDSHTDSADWTGVPADVAPVLRRALAWNPRDRYPDAGEFRRALTRTSEPPRTGRGTTAAISSFVALVTAIGLWLVFRPHPSPPAAEGISLRIAPLAEENGAADPLGDTLSARLTRALSGAPDLNVATPPGDSADLLVEGTLSGRSDSLGARLRVTTRGKFRRQFTLARTGAIGAVVDSLAHDLLLNILQLPASTFGDALPAEALPTTTDGLIGLARAEALYAGAQWVAARQAYENALATDASCALCSLRLITMAQWARLSPDTANTRQVRAAIGRFPARYQLLIRTLTDTADRWALRDSLITQFPRFDLGHFLYGDEIFHRGPLSGRSRRLALDHLRAVTALRPHFAPAWEHQAWIAISEGDLATTQAALGEYSHTTDLTDPGTMVIWMLLNVAQAWRFGSTAQAEAVTEGALSRPEVANVPDLHSGPRYLLAFDVPEGVLWLGRRFAEWPGRTELKPHGLAGEIAALMALGRPDAALRIAGQLRGESPDAEYTLVSAQYDAALTLFDSLDAEAAWPRLRDALSPLAQDGSGSAIQRVRAAFWLALLARRAGESAAAPTWASALRGANGAAPFVTLLAADSLAAADPARAIRLTRPLLALDSAGRSGDPFFRSALHLLRAQWLLAGAQPDTAAAERELLWYENSDVVGQSTAIVQAVDVDWAFGTLARWYRSGLTRTPGGSETCRALAGVSRLWRHGESRYQARAARAQALAARLECPPAQ